MSDVDEPEYRTPEKRREEGLVALADTVQAARRTEFWARRLPDPGTGPLSEEMLARLPVLASRTFPPCGPRPRRSAGLPQKRPAASPGSFSAGRAFRRASRLAVQLPIVLLCCAHVALLLSFVAMYSALGAHLVGLGFDPSRIIALRMVGLPGMFRGADRRSPGRADRCDGGGAGGLRDRRHRAGGGGCHGAAVLLWVIPRSAAGCQTSDWRETAASDLPQEQALPPAAARTR